MAKAYREMVIRGDDKIMKGFLACYRSTHRIKSGLIMAREHAINTHHLKEIITLRHSHLHLVLASDHRAGLLAALRPVATELGLQLLSDRAIRRAWFDYRFRTANRRVAGTIKKVFAGLPADLRRTGTAHRETVDPTARGVEVYSPAHEYEFVGQGQIAGDFEAILKLHTRLVKHEFIDVDDINLSF